MTELDLLLSTEVLIFVHDRRSFFASVFGLLFGFIVGLLLSSSRYEKDILRSQRNLPWPLKLSALRLFSGASILYYCCVITLIVFGMAIPTIFFDFMPLRSEAEGYWYKGSCVLGLGAGFFIRRAFWHHMSRNG